VKFDYFVDKLVNYCPKQTILLNRVTCISKSTVFLSKHFLVRNDSLNQSLNPVFDLFLIENVGISGSTPALSDVKFKDYANGIYVAAGSYYVTITVAGDPSTVAIDSAPATLADGVVYQVVAIDDSMGTGFNLIVSDTTD
jgi:hypothetical protein